MREELRPVWVQSLRERGREGGGGGVGEAWRGGEVRRYSIYWLICSCLSLEQACQIRHCLSQSSHPIHFTYVFSILFPTQRHRRRPMVFSDKRGTSAWTTSSLFCWETTRTLNHLRAVAASSPILTRRSMPQTITDNGYWRTSKYVVIYLMTDCDWLINWSIVWLTAWITDHLIYWLLE